MEITHGKKYKNKNIQGKSLMPLVKVKKMKKETFYFFEVIKINIHPSYVEIGSW